MVSVVLNIYDVTNSESEGFNNAVELLNGFTRELGLGGAFHGGVAVADEVEWSFGYCERGTGVYACHPAKNPAYKFREAIPLGTTSLTRDQVLAIVRMLERRWPGRSYNLLSRNCCHFCEKFIEDLEVGPMPGWVNRLAYGADNTVSFTTNAMDKPCAPFSGSVARPSLSRAARGASVTTCAIQKAPAAPKVRVNDGPEMWSRTYYPTKADAAKAQKDWYIVDAEGQTLGRLATMVASYIRGKHLPTYTPSMDMGAYVVVINSEKVAVSGKKEQQKTYFRHSTGRPGKHHTENLATLRARLPERIVERAVKGMLPKGRLGRSLFNHLKVYKGSEHPHEAQQPIDITNRINKKASAMPAS